MDKLIDLLALETVSVEPKVCLNFANKHSVCQACVIACPTQAIMLEKQLPSIDQDNCLDCGLCISSCPTLAIDHVQVPYIELSRQIEQFPASTITCGQFAEYQRGIKVPCYLYLDEALLAHLSRQRESKTIDVYLGKCEKCNKSDSSRVKLHLETIQKKLNNWQIPISIQFNTAELDNTTDQVINGLTRRELFQKFSFQRLRGKINDKEGSSGNNVVSFRLSNRDRSLFKQRLLNRQLRIADRDQRNSSISAIGLAGIAKISSCNGCNVCEQICPTGALKWQDSGGESRLFFDVQDCLFCQKCLVCPEHSIQFGAISQEEYLTAKKKLLMTLKLNTCTKCGESFRSEQKEEICSFCEAQERKHVNYFS